MTELNEKNFEQEVINADGKVLVDFWAPWCGPCKMLSPVLEKLSKTRTDVKFTKVNVDEEVPLAMKYKVSAIPTVLLFDSGEMIDKFVGFRDESAVEEFLG